MPQGSAHLKKIVATLIPVHNGLAFTKKCLNELEKKLKKINSGPFEFRIIVIDDGSEDGTAEWIHEKYPEVVVLHGNGNLWWSGSVNMGARYALDKLNAAYVLLWNNDIGVCEDYFTHLIHAANNTDNTTIIGSKIFCDKEYNLVWSAGGKFNPITGNKYMIGYMKHDHDEFQQVIEVDWLTGMGTLIPCHVIQKVGFWNQKRFPQYYGDSDFTYRAKLKGFHIQVHPQLKIINDISNSGVKKAESFRDLYFVLTNIKSVHHVGKNFLFYWYYARSPLAYANFFMIYIYFFGGFFKRQILKLFSGKSHSDQSFITN